MAGDTSGRAGAGRPPGTPPNFVPMVSTGRSSAKAASALGLAAELPMLMIRRVAWTYNDQPVEYRVSWVDTRAHDYLSDLWKANQGGLPGA